MIKIILPFCVLLLAACGNSESSSQSGEGAGSDSSVEKVASSVQAAGDTAADWTRKAGTWMVDTWESLKKSSAENAANVKESLDEATVVLGKQIDSAQQTAGRLTGSAKVQVEKGIEGLKKARNEIADVSSRISTATAEQWPELQKELGDAWTQAGKSMTAIWDAAGDSGAQQSSESPNP